MQNQDFIPGIYNYCDRWCERCALSARCRVYAMEQATAMKHAGSQDLQQAFWQSISSHLEEAFRILHQIVQERGINLDALPEEPEKEHNKCKNFFLFYPIFLV